MERLFLLKNITATFFHALFKWCRSERKRHFFARVACHKSKKVPFTHKGAIEKVSEKSVFFIFWKMTFSYFDKILSNIFFRTDVRKKNYII